MLNMPTEPPEVADSNIDAASKTTFVLSNFIYLMDK